MEVNLNSELKIPDVVVQDRYPDTLLANDGPAAVDQIVIKSEEVVAKETLWVQDGEKMVMEEVVMGVVTVLPDSEGPSQCHTNPTVQARIRTFS
jgi:hypothetical protein